jgi:uncharacterized protein YgbK (DUF1537 family)
MSRPNAAPLSRRPMPELAIIADDLTGALDAAAPFAMRGIKTSVALRASALPQAVGSGAKVVGVSTHSRDIPPDQAREAVRTALEALPSKTKIFKKIDSRLKGNIAAELDAITYARSLVIPAIPAFDRWTRHGKLGGFGVDEPIDIAARLGRHAIAAAIPDTATQADIESALAIAHDLLVGARSAAEAVAQEMAPDATLSEPSVRSSTCYCVIGSTDPITLAQLDRLRESVAGLTYVAAPNGAGPKDLRSASGFTIIQAVAGAIGADASSVASALARTLARCEPQPGSLLVLSGGATAQAVLAHLNIDVLDVIGEIMPGLPVVQGGGLTVVTKSGGFGNGETLVQLFARFTGIRSA